MYLRKEYACPTNNKTFVAVAKCFENILLKNVDLQHKSICTDHVI